MKRIQLNYLLLIILALCAHFANAHDFEVDGIYYNYINNSSPTNYKVSVTYRGYEYYDYSNEYSGYEAIPSYVTYNGKTYRVTAIEDNAFRSCEELISVLIPKTVTSIGESAFRGCSSLTNVFFSDSENAELLSIGNYAFFECSALTGITLPESVTEIGNYAFKSCSSLTGFYLGNYVASIGNYAFSGCSGLTNVTIPNSIVSIGDYAFNNCSKLSILTIPDFVSHIGYQAFVGTLWYNNQPDGVIYAGKVAHSFKGTMPSGTNISLIQGTLGVAYKAFFGCSGLTRITIPNTIVQIDCRAFEQCNNLLSIAIPNSITNISNYLFYGCSGLTSITIPNSVTSIGESAFSGCTGLTNIFIPNSITSISKFTFNNCSSLSSFSIPNTVTIICNFAFYGCSSLTSITIPSSVTDIGSSAFVNCDELSSITCLNSNPPTIIDSDATPGWISSPFSDYVYTYATLYVPSGAKNKYLSTQYWYRFVNIVELGAESILATSISLNKTSATMTQGNTMQLTATVLPTNATNRTVTWKSSNTSVATVSSSGLVAAKSPGSATITATTTDGTNLSASCAVTVQQNIIYATSISLDKTSAELTEGNTLQLTATVLPTNASNRTLSWKSSNTSVATVNSSGLVTAKSPGSATITATTTDGTNLSASCYVTVFSQGSIITFADANVKAICVQNWDTNHDGELSKAEAAAVTTIGTVFEHNSTISSFQELQYFTGLNSIGEYAFYYCQRLNSITIPTSVTSIDKCAFENCFQLTSVTIPTSVTSIGPWAFDSCEGLTSISIPNSVTLIDSAAFQGCSGLTSIDIPNSVTLVECAAFQSCINLTDVTIGNSVTSIGERAFCYCINLTSVNIPSTVTSIGDYAFKECTSLLSLNYNAVNCADFSSYTTGKSPFYRLNISSINIGNQVERIPAYFVYGLTQLTSISIPRSVTSIGEYAFCECPNLNSVNIYDLDAWCKILFSSCLNWYPFHLFLNGVEVIDLVIPISVTSIGDNTFSRCSWLTSITIHNAVTSIGCAAFSFCSSLTDVTIGNSVTSIGQMAFSDCGNLTSVNIPSTVTSIGQSAFENCARLTSVHITDLEAWCKIRFAGLWTSNPLYYANHLILNGEEIKNLNIPSTVTSVGDNAFVGCSITSATIPSSVTFIGKYAFEDCSELTSITIPKSVSTINDYAFHQCTSLNDVYCHIVNPSSLSMGNYVFYRYPYNQAQRTLHVPVGSVTAYQSDTKWSEFFGSVVEIPILATSISLNKTNATVTEGNTLQLTATVLPTNATNRTVSWKSSNTSVATVSSIGLVTAKSPGSATITATTTDGTNLSASCSLTVQQNIIYATSISLNQTSATLYTGNTLQLSATVLPSTTSNPSVTWSSSNTSVVTVSSTGLVTAKSTGNVVITARTSDGSNLSATCNVTVKRLATSISLNKTSATLYLDQTVQLTATVSPSNATDRSVVWSSSDNSIATVSSTGLVTAIATGNATITATTADGSNLSATCVITVKAYVTSLTFDQSAVTILEGDTITLTPTILPTYATNQNLNWSSNNTGVATVNNGIVIGRSGGETTITARTVDGSNLSATCKVTVIPNFDISMPNFSHIRGSANNTFDLTVDLANRYDITGMQFDIQFPEGVTIAKDNNGEYDIWPDDSRKTRNHTATASLIGNNSYRILVSSATANSLKGHSGTVVHIMIEIPLYHVSGNKQIKYSNIILSEPDETRHTLPTKYSMISYYYKEGDANADVSVDVADYVITGNYILQNSPEYFWYDAANVDHNSTIDVNDLTGITNIALGRREGGILQMPAMQASEDIELTANPLAIEAGQTKTLNFYLDGIHEFAGFQMDLELPKGIRLVDASLVDENSGFSIATAELTDGRIRLLSSSFSLKSLAVSKSAFLKLTLMAESGFNGNDIITLDNVKFSERNMDLHTLDNVVIPVGNDVSSLEQVYSVTLIYAEGNNIIIDSPESGTARIVTISGITQVRDVVPGHNVIPMEDSGFYIVTLNGTTAKLRLN